MPAILRTSSCSDPPIEGSCWQSNTSSTCVTWIKLVDIGCYQVKLALLNYIHALVLAMPADALTNTSDTRLAVSRFITWASEPKSSEVRKVMVQYLVFVLMNYSFCFTNAVSNHRLFEPVNCVLSTFLSAEWSLYVQTLGTSAVEHRACLSTAVDY